MVKPKVNIVMPTWNALEYTKITLSRLFESTKVPFTLTIIDNASRKETIDFLKKIKSQGSCIKINKIFNQKNLGSGRAFNQGWQISREEDIEFTCLINNDLYFSRGWLEALLTEMEAPKIGAVAPIGVSQYSNYFDGMRNSRKVFEELNKDLSPQDELIDFFEGDLDRNMKKFCQSNTSQIFTEIPSFLPSHCLLVRSKIIEEIGFIADPIYKTYGCDDVDLSWEILCRGYFLKISNQTLVYHFRHRSITEHDLNRKEKLAKTTKNFLNKWHNTITKLTSQDDFFEKFFDLSFQQFAILRKMNQECHFLEEKSKIFATFACLGKTNFSKKYPHLSRDLEISNFRCLFKSSEDIEGLEPTLEQDVNPHFPQNYLCAIGKNYGKKAIIFIALSPEIMRILDNLGVLYSVIYPEKNMAPEILKRAKDRGNNKDFIKLLRKNLSNNNELNHITSNTRPKRIIIAKNQDTIESILKNDHEIQNILLRNSSFTYKGVCYSVVFKSLINKRVPNKNWGQVYAVGRINNQVPIVKYNKKGFISFNLPGGGTESGESYEETLRRELLEELNMRVLDFEPIGYQINVASNGKKYYQLRVFATLEKVGDFKKDVGGSVIGYELENIQTLNDRINWGEVGDWFTLILQDKYEK